MDSYITTLIRPTETLKNIVVLDSPIPNLTLVIKVLSFIGDVCLNHIDTAAIGLLTDICHDILQSFQANDWQMP
jgi:hypothetical protein